MERSTEYTNHCHLRIVIGLVVLLSGPSLASGGVMPLGQPEYDFLYQQMLRRQTLTTDLLDYQVGPYRFEMFSDRLDPFTAWPNPAQNEMLLFGFASEKMRAAKNSDPTGYESIRAGFTGEPLDKISVYVDFVLDEERALDPTYSGKKWRGLAGDVDQAFASLQTDRLSVIVGRFGGFWGPPSSLLFSPNQKLDGLTYSVRWGRFGFSYRLGALDRLSPDGAGIKQFESRYIAAHRFDFHLSSRVRLGLFESVVFGGPGRTIDLFYLNPLIFMHGSQLNENLDDNTIVGFDFEVQPLAKSRFYGQLLVDDLQVDDKIQADQEPAQYGLLVGGYLANLTDGLDAQFEYSRVTNWTFNQRHARNRYLNNSRPIGSALGNDYDLVSLQVIKWLGPQLALSVNLAHYRQGEGRITDEWSQPWLAVEGDYSEPFPTGVVQKTGNLSVGLKGFITSFAFVDLEGGVDRVANLGNICGDDHTLPFVNLYVSLVGLTSLNLQ